MENNNKIIIKPIGCAPIMSVQLDLNLEKLKEFIFQIHNKDKTGVQVTNLGGWHSTSILKENQEEFYKANINSVMAKSLLKETHEEFIKLKKEITQYLQIYHSKVFRGMVFKGNGNVTFNISEMWANINEKYHSNEWHLHPHSTLSGTYYIKHDGSEENGNILFHHPKHTYLTISHWPIGLVEEFNEVTAEVSSIIPKPNTLLIFPSWLEHKAEINLKNDSRISIAFNSIPKLEKHD
jgi:uncharacterized protein (TIGR02466 family)